MAGALNDCIAAGSVGFSTGLMYAPGSSAPFEELALLCGVTARAGGIYCTHMRSYSWELLESLEEQIQLARLTGCRLQLSHLQAVGRVNWNKQELVFERIERARREGLDIEFDIYPYQAGSTVLTQFLPQRALNGGTASLMCRLCNSAEREDIVRETEARLAQSWTDIVISSVRTVKNQSFVGRSIAAIASERELSPAEAVMELLIEEEAEVNIVSFNQSETNLRALLTHPLCTVISDGFYVNGRPHPRLFGTFPELLGRYCRDQRWLTLPDAIHKITQKPAERFGLKGRGILRRGAFADVTLFDPKTIRSTATYDDPERPPEGIRLVLHNGREVYPAAR